MHLLITLAQETVVPARSGAPLRVFAAILLIVILCGVIYVLRHLTKIKSEIASDDLIPPERGARDNMLFIIGAVLFFAVGLLLYLLVKA